MNTSIHRAVGFGGWGAHLSSACSHREARKCFCKLACPGRGTLSAPARAMGVGHQCPLLVTVGNGSAVLEVESGVLSAGSRSDGVQPLCVSQTEPGHE